MEKKARYGELDPKRVRAKIAENGYTQNEVANKLGLDSGSFSKKINGKNGGLNEKQFFGLLNILKVNTGDVGYFFTTVSPNGDKEE